MNMEIDQHSGFNHLTLGSLRVVLFFETYSFELILYRFLLTLSLLHVLTYFLQNAIVKYLYQVDTVSNRCKRPFNNYKNRRIILPVCYLMLVQSHYILIFQYLMFEKEDKLY